MASSVSSSSAGAKLFAVWLYSFDTGKSFPARFALVDVPVQSGPDVPQTIPMLVTYQNNYYVWSTVRFGYVQQAPYQASLDTGQPLLSVVCNPQA